MPTKKPILKIAALLVGLISIVAGVVGLVSPDTLTNARCLYFAAPERFYAAGAIRMSMGLVTIFFAPRSRAPMILRGLGAVMCMQALSGTLLGPAHARDVLEWETAHAILLPVGAAVALVAGGFIVFAAMAGRNLDY